VVKNSEIVRFYEHLRLTNPDVSLVELEGVCHTLPVFDDRAREKFGAKVLEVFNRFCH
jgi:hypothetical protein